jgi:signal transduction histidine kinase
MAALAPLERGSRRPLAPTIAALTMATGIIALTAGVAIRGLVRQDYRDSEQAATVIAVAKLRAGIERLAAGARLFTAQDPARIAARTRDLEASLQGMSRPLDPERRRMASEVQSELRQYSAALQAALSLRAQGIPAVARAFQERVQPRREALDAAVDRLAGAEEAELAALEEAGEAISSTMTTVAFAVAMVAILSALVLGVLLARSFESLTRKGRELERAKVQLEAANRDLEAFAARVAHDLRTPLTPITLLAGSLRKRSNDPLVIRTAERICASARRASEMVDGLLAFSRAEGEGRAATPAAPIVEECLEQIAEQLGAAAVEVRRDLDPGAIVACPASLYRQVVDNLLGNAVKHLAARERRSLCLRVGAVDDKVRLEVEDSGPGIPPESLGRIFDPYYRVPGNATPGTGIGLATVHRIVESHGGEIRVSSQLGAGTVFTVDLPAARTNPLPSRRDGRAELTAAPASH